MTITITERMIELFVYGGLGCIGLLVLAGLFFYFITVRKILSEMEKLETKTQSDRTDLRAAGRQTTGNITLPK